jgi:hypothetical protein
MAENVPTPSPEILALIEEYNRLSHAMMTGVGYDLEYNRKQAEPKHVRAGINSALVCISALTKLFMAKGLISELEYWQALNAEMAAEVARYEASLEARTGGRTKVTLV